jgi:hypothetical protein
MSNNHGRLIIGGIIKHDGGIGFKLTFKDKEQAQYYKKMVFMVLEDDFDNITMNHGCYDEVKQ